jgi:hypothetical protein
LAYYIAKLVQLNGKMSVPGENESGTRIPACQLPATNGATSAGLTILQERGNEVVLQELIEGKI